MVLETVHLVTGAFSGALVALVLLLTAVDLNVVVFTGGLVMTLAGLVTGLVVEEKVLARFTAGPFCKRITQVKLLLMFRIIIMTNEGCHLFAV